MNSTPNISIIGLGLMGQALAERLLGASFEVHGFDPNAAQMRAFAAIGGKTSASAGAAAEASPVILLSLPDHHVVTSVLAEISPVLKTGQTIIDTTTGSPEEAGRSAAEMRARDVAFLDAPVSGSSEQTRRGEGVILAGGDAEAFARCQPVWRALAPTALHLGASGSGARMKLVTNLVLGLNRAALAEGLVFAQMLGLDPQPTLETLMVSASYSRVMDTKGVKMLGGEFTPQARLSQHLKDVRLMLAAAHAHNQELPLTQAHRLLLERAEALGCGALDNSAIIRAYKAPSA